MKRVEIATFHFANNYGAVLQCYALQRVINNLDGVCAEIIDYRPPQYQYRRVWTNEKEKNLFLKKRELFEKFLVQYCNLSSRRVSIIDGNGYDYCCVGSDQIWNPYVLFEEYFLPNISEKTKKVSYAASIGCSISKLKLKNDIFLKYLPDFKAISLREIEHTEYLSTVSGKKCEWVLDPTLLLDADDYLSVIGSKQVEIGKPYLLFYWLLHDRELFRGIELANMVARKFGLQIVHSIFGAKETMFFQEAKCMYYDGIQDFLWYVKNASFVITNSYHGTLFSLQFEVPFYSFVVDSMKSRFNTLSAYIGVENRFVTKMFKQEDINTDIDYKKIKEEILKYRNGSINYLKEALDVK